MASGKDERISVPCTGIIYRPVVRVVFLHALPLDGSMWANELQIHGEPAIAPTLYRFGDSLAAWAAGVLDVVGGGRLVVVGCSVGGSCALELARLAPDRVAAIVLMGAKASVRPEPHLRDEAIQVLAEGGMAKAWPRYWAPLFSNGAKPELVEAARQTACAQDTSDVIAGVRAFHNRSDRSDFVRGWDKPLVVVAGDQDQTPPRSTVDELARSAPRGEVHLVQNAGHYVNLEQPSATGEILQRVLRDVVHHC